MVRRSQPTSWDNIFGDVNKTMLAHVVVCTIKAQSLPQQPGCDSCPWSFASCLLSIPYLPVLLYSKKDKTFKQSKIITLSYKRLLPEQLTGNAAIQQFFPDLHQHWAVHVHGLEVLPYKM